MCCFSRNAVVAETNIFARGSRDSRQFLAYSMRFSSKEDLAMILPIPTPRNAPEDAVHFINLEKYAGFFQDLRAGFPLPKSNGRGTFSAGPASKLKVIEVGSFEASFVPAIKDFNRLDERFRLSADAWDKLPTYKDFGFAVFKLKKGEEQKVHPLALDFPRARPNQLFFPTVHIHDGQVHARARFDHALYCQLDKLLPGWVESKQPAAMFMKLKLAEGLLDGTKHCHMKEIRGVQKNEDILI